MQGSAAVSTFTITDAERVLNELLPPWVREMDISFDSIAKGEAVLRIPPAARLNREGGTLSGQAIMALADTAMIFAVAAFSGAFVPMTTINQTASFLRPAADADVLAVARIIKPGKTTMYGEVHLHAGNPDKPIAHVTSTYMLL